MPKIVEVRPDKDYTLHLRLADGTSKTVCIAHLLWGEMFVPLKDVDLFNQVKVDRLGAVYWPNGADLAPDGDWF